MAGVRRRREPEGTDGSGEGPRRRRRSERLSTRPEGSSAAAPSAQARTNPPSALGTTQNEPRVRRNEEPRSGGQGNGEPCLGFGLEDELREQQCGTEPEMPQPEPNVRA